jgi:hypothetical protein
MCLTLITSLVNRTVYEGKNIQVNYPVVRMRASTLRD